jgi:hypothetical protein
LGQAGTNQTAYARILQRCFGTPAILGQVTEFKTKFAQ